MASPSPVKITGAALDGGALSAPLVPASSKSLRGLNKPKCIKCGNVARSRCPYQSCKSCCSKAQNPCHIHVLKGGSSLPEKLPSSSSPLSDQHSTDAPHLGNSHRLRHLSSNFAQFSSLQTSRPRKPLTKKDAQVINEWRFMKLKEFKDGKALVESEAFDRYVQNVSLLEEVFAVHSESVVPEDHLLTEQHQSPGTESLSSDDKNTENMVSVLSLKLRSDIRRSESFRKRIKDIVDQGLRNLQKDANDPTDEFTGAGTERPEKKMKSSQSEWETALSELSDKLQKARNDDDFNECRAMAFQVFKSKPQSSQTEPEGLPTPEEKGCIPQPEVSLLPKWYTTVTVDQDTICKIDAKFSSLEEIEDL